MRRIDLPVEEVIARYGAGESTWALGDAYGVDHKTIRQRLFAAGVKLRSRRERKRGGPFHADGHGYLGTYTREGKQCSIHRGCWEAYHGPIPDGYVIHHRDKNRQQNDVGNLTCVLHGEHIGIHNTMRGR